MRRRASDGGRRERRFCCRAASLVLLDEVVLCYGVFFERDVRWYVGAIANEEARSYVAPSSGATEVAVTERGFASGLRMESGQVAG
jgi:hypothetical protein